MNRRKQDRSRQDQGGPADPCEGPEVAECDKSANYGDGDKPDYKLGGSVGLRTPSRDNNRDNQDQSSECRQSGDEDVRWRAALPTVNTFTHTNEPRAHDPPVSSGPRQIGSASHLTSICYQITHLRQKKMR
jgi:hypothetical protein